ncbi:immunoglobulin domain protein, partial [Ancylostoma duodenale]
MNVIAASPTVISPTDHNVNYSNVGDSLSIECKADGVPPPEITWTKNEKIVSTGPVLNITKLQKHHEGIYTCLAVNVEGRATSQFELKFSKVPTFDFVPTNKTVVEGSNVFWRCHVDAQPTGILYTWIFRDRPIKTTETGLRVDIKVTCKTDEMKEVCRAFIFEGGDLSLRDVRKYDRGWYVCNAHSPSGEQSQASAYLDVLYAPEALPSHRQVLTIGYGQNGTISCAVDANPMPSHYTWSKNGHFVSTTAEASILCCFILEERVVWGGMGEGGSKSTKAGAQIRIGTHLSNY